MCGLGKSAREESRGLFGQGYVTLRMDGISRREEKVVRRVNQAKRNEQESEERNGGRIRKSNQCTKPAVSMFFLSVKRKKNKKLRMCWSGKKMNDVQMEGTKFGASIDKL